jgi:uncharacterized protein (DUF2062 family)
VNAPGPDPAATAVRPGFWRRRVVDPLVALLTQGVTPDWLAATLAACSVCSLFPSLGATSALNLGLGLWLRMNQPVLQCLNQLPGPVLVAMILVYVRIGERIWRAPEADRFSLWKMMRAFGELPFTGFLQRFGQSGVHAMRAGALTAIYQPLRPVFRRWATSGTSGRDRSTKPTPGPTPSFNRSWRWPAWPSSSPARFASAAGSTTTASWTSSGPTLSACLPGSKRW